MLTVLSLTCLGNGCVGADTSYSQWTVYLFRGKYTYRINRRSGDLIFNSLNFAKIFQMLSGRADATFAAQPKSSASPTPWSWTHGCTPKSFKVFTRFANGINAPSYSFIDVAIQHWTHYLCDLRVGCSDDLGISDLHQHPSKKIWAWCEVNMCRWRSLAPILIRVASPTTLF